MTDKLINTGKVTETVNIVGPAGERDEVFLQPGGRLTLPFGFKVDPNFAANKPMTVLINPATSGA